MIEESRRDFIKQVLTATVVTVSAPHIVLGRITPEILKNDDELLGIYKIDLTKYPVLKELWGSVRIKLTGYKGMFPSVILTHVPIDDWGVDYICVSEQCPHEGFPVKDLDPESGFFECSGHGTLFTVDGVYFWGPASKDLYRFPLEYPEGDAVFIQVPFPTGIEEELSDKSNYIWQNAPNPCSDFTSIDFHIDKASDVSVRIYDITGNEIKSLGSKHTESGKHRIILDVSGFSPGMYSYNMYINNRRIASRKMLVER